MNLKIEEIIKLKDFKGRERAQDRSSSLIWKCGDRMAARGIRKASLHN